MVFSAIVFFAPTMGGYFLEANNFIPSDSLKTPPHIAPVWYFTPFYSMLRATTDDFKHLLMGLAVIVTAIWWVKGQSGRDHEGGGVWRRRVAAAGDVSDRGQVLGRGGDGRRGGHAVLPAVAGP